MKKILYVEGCLEGTVGGSHTCLYSLLANLDRQMYYPIVIFYNDNIVASKLRNLGIETHIFRKNKTLNFGQLSKKVAPSLQNISVLFLLLQKALNFGFYFLRPALLYAMYLKKRKIDIVHLNNSINSNLDWMAAAKLTGTKIISHERGINNNLSRTSKYFGYTLDLMICMSKAIKYPLVIQGLPEKRIIVIYDGIDFSRIQIKKDSKEIRRLYGLGNGDPVIGVVGNIKEWKGQETVIRATGLLKNTWPDVKCLLVGGTVDEDPYKEKLNKIIEELKIKENIIFTGFQQNPVDFVNAMDVVVHSSIEPEPFGMVNLEAMYMKKPVVSTNIGGPTEIFRDGEDGILIEPGNPALLAQKISVLLNDPELRTRMGQKASEAVIGRFNISDTVHNIENAYKEM